MKITYHVFTADELFPIQCYLRFPR